MPWNASISPSCNIVSTILPSPIFKGFRRFMQCTALLIDSCPPATTILINNNPTTEVCAQMRYILLTLLFSSALSYQENKLRLNITTTHLWITVHDTLNSQSNALQAGAAEHIDSIGWCILWNACTHGSLSCGILTLASSKHLTHYHFAYIARSDIGTLWWYIKKKIEKLLFFLERKTCQPGKKPCLTTHTLLTSPCVHV